MKIIDTGSPEDRQCETLNCEFLLLFYLVVENIVILLCIELCKDFIY